MKGKASKVQGSRGKWTEAAMLKALEDIALGRRKLREASRYYCIPESSFRAWRTGKASLKKTGAPTVLNAEEQRALVAWSEERQRVARCVSLTLLRCKVKQICQDRQTPFTDGILGETLVEGI